MVSTLLSSYGTALDTAAGTGDPVLCWNPGDIQEAEPARSWGFLAGVTGQCKHVLLWVLTFLGA